MGTAEVETTSLVEASEVVGAEVDNPYIAAVEEALELEKVDGKVDGEGAALDTLHIHYLPVVVVAVVEAAHNSLVADSSTDGEEVVDSMDPDTLMEEEQVVLPKQDVEGGNGCRGGDVEVEDKHMDEDGMATLQVVAADIDIEVHVEAAAEACRDEVHKNTAAAVVGFEREVEVVEVGLRM